MTTKRRKAKKARRVCMWEVMQKIWKGEDFGVSQCQETLTVHIWRKRHLDAFSFCPHCGLPVKIKGPKGGRK